MIRLADVMKSGSMMRTEIVPKIMAHFVEKAAEIMAGTSVMMPIRCI